MSPPADAVDGLLRRLADADIRLSIHLDIDHPGRELPADRGLEILARRPRLLYRLAQEAVWESLRGLRWAGATDDDGNLVIDRPDREKGLAAVSVYLSDPDDPEREAIRR